MMILSKTYTIWGDFLKKIPNSKLKSTYKNEHIIRKDFGSFLLSLF